LAFWQLEIAAFLAAISMPPLRLCNSNTHLYAFLQLMLCVAQRLISIYTTLT